MKIIKLEDFPIEMTNENIDALAKMMEAFPPLGEWSKIAELITYEEKRLIWDRASEIQKEKEEERWNSLSKEEQEEERRKIEKSLQEGSEVFKGNILQQEWDSIRLSEIEKERQKKNSKK